MTTNQEFIAKIKSFYCKVVTLLCIILIGILVSQHITVAQDSEVRVIDINLPFYKTQFLQSRK